MCGRYRVTESSLRAMAKELRVKVPEFTRRDNHAPTMPGPVLRSGRDEIELMRWGFNAPSGPDSALRLLINARSETVHQLRSFKQAWRERRCLVPADWFYEWDQATKPKQPWRFVRENDQPMIIAGIWSQSRMTDGSLVDAYAVLTTPANDVVAKVHDRMPVILHERDWLTWLDPASTAATLQALHRPFDGPMYARPVDRAMNKAAYQDEVHDVTLAPHKPPAQGELF